MKNTDPTLLNVDFIEPGLVAFTEGMPVRNTYEICYWCNIFMIKTKIEDFISNLFFELEARYVSWRISKKHEEIEKQRIKNLARSYNRAFQQFNDPRHSSFLETDPETGERRRATIYQTTNRNNEELKLLATKHGTSNN